MRNESENTFACESALITAENSSYDTTLNGTYLDCLLVQTI